MSANAVTPATVADYRSLPASERPQSRAAPSPLPVEVKQGGKAALVREPAATRESPFDPL